jgi:hypothetical protein
VPRVCFYCGESTDETTDVVKWRAVQINVLAIVLRAVFIVQFRVDRGGKVGMRKDRCFRGESARTAGEHEATIVSNIPVFCSHHTFDDFLIPTFFYFFLFFFRVMLNHVDIFQRKRSVHLLLVFIIPPTAFILFLILFTTRRTFHEL